MMKAVFSVAEQYDVYVTALGADTTRQSAAAKLVALYPLDGARKQSVARGERILLRGEVSSNEAQRISTDLRALGFRVDLEARSSAFEAVGLDGAAVDDDSPRASSFVAGDNPLFNVSAGLVGLDGADEPPPTLAKASTTGVDSLVGLFGGSASLSELDGAPVDEPVPQRRAPPPTPRAAPPPPRAAPPPPPRVPPPPAPVAAPASRFRPAGEDDAASELKLDREERDPNVLEARPEERGEDVFEVPRCPTHDVPKQNGRCPQCDAEDRYVQSRFMGGSLRQKPGLRIGMGLGAGLFIGWLATMPMAKHGEMKVQNMREQAAREHERPTEEAQANAALLDAKADDLSQDAFIHTFGTWALITAAVTGVWMKLT